MKQTRQAEFARAANALGISYEALELSDLGLSFMPYPELFDTVLNRVRTHNPGVIFTFHPYEISREFDHPDHRMVGQITLDVAATTDVAHFKPGVPVMNRRPNLFLWTTNRYLASHSLSITKNERSSRLAYLEEEYPSQFPKESIPKAKIIFDRLTRQRQNHRELYLKVR